MGKKKVLIIGGGCSGHVAALLLDENFKSYVLEANDRWGGHNDTQIIGPNEVVVDAGAAFINKKYCHNLYKLLEYYDTDLLSFTLVTHYFMNSKNIDIVLPPIYINDHNHLKVEWSSLFNRKNIGIMAQMQIVLNKAKSIIKEKNTQLTIEEFLDSIKIGAVSPISNYFKENVLYPLIANAYFVDQEYYVICEMAEEDTIQKNHFYVELQDHYFNYRVINPDGELVTGKIDYVDIGLNQERIDIEDIAALKSEIFTLTSEKAHTFEPDPNRNIRKFSAYAALNYLFQGSDIKRGQWQELKEGLGQYLAKIRNDSTHTQFLLQHPVKSIENIGSAENPSYKVVLEDGSPFMQDDKVVTFDAIVLATNGYQAGKLLLTLPSHTDIGKRLKNLQYYTTRVDVFGKTGKLPPKPRTVNSDGDGRQVLFFEPRAKEYDYPILRTTNREIDANDVPLYHANYLHPFLDPDFYETSDAIRDTNGLGNIWIAGAFADGGDSQENAINAGIRAAHQITERFNVKQSSLFSLFDLEDLEDIENLETNEQSFIIK